MEDLDVIADRITRRNKIRAEATLQADIRSFILTADLNVSDGQMQDVPMESQIGDGSRHRIDIETGSTVIEVKRDLRAGSTKSDAEGQLAGYVQTRRRQTGARFIGVLTDGRDWYLYVPDPDGVSVIEASHLRTSSRKDTEALRYWLGTILATQEDLPPSAQAIERNLGAGSPAHDADHATLTALFEQGSASPEVALKRELWGKLLRTAFGSDFDDDASLFVDHTLLVLTAEIIAHAALGFDVGPTGRLTPSELAQGTKFSEAQIFGVVESDFFDWPIEVPGGAEFIRSLATRLSRFRWSQPEHDVLKHLYEAVISQETRQALGEYYTPDWLADAIISETVSDPLHERVLDPSCGSGTFIFHAVRRYLSDADETGLSVRQALDGVTQRVMGMDLHPVAVTLARVTYLLAIGTERLQSEDRGPLSIPVYLGDSLQWEERADLMTSTDNVVVSTTGSDLAQGQEPLALEGGDGLFSDDLVFPRSVLADAQRFDSIVAEMASLALDESRTMDKTLMEPVLDRGMVDDPAARATLLTTFAKMRDLQRRGRDHIWGYYVRNLIRPLWLSLAEHRVDVLVGNPPWLRYSKMSSAMQERYRRLAEEKGLLSGPKGASGRDLSTLFLVRCLERYGTPTARFAFVMPHGTLTRYPHAGFRSGRWGATQRAAFEKPWDLQDMARATGFPITSCVVRGRSGSTPCPLGASTQRWSAHGVTRSTSWADASLKTERTTGEVYVQANADDETSPYEGRFRNGAIIYPRALLFVTEEDAGPLGLGAGRARVRSRRSTLEKKPWRDVPDLTGTVERAFIHPVHLGETLLPYRMADPLTAVLPISVDDSSGLAPEDELSRYPGMATWWDSVERVWRENRVRSERKPLRERIDYSGQLSAQLPMTNEIRVVYSASGNTLTAATVLDPYTVIEHKLYWCAARSLDEARYLVGILNSDTLLQRVRPMQAIGLFGPRDFDKNVFKVPFGGYDPTNKAHERLTELVARAEAQAATIDVSDTKDFKQARRTIREELTATGLISLLEESVDAVLPHVEI